MFHPNCPACLGKLSTVSYSGTTTASHANLPPNVSFTMVSHNHKVAHESEDSAVFHCPFCGSGQVTARSDRTIECEFCNRYFTVSEQPQYSAMPQAIDGEPYENPALDEESAEDEVGESLSDEVDAEDEDDVQSGNDEDDEDEGGQTFPFESSLKWAVMGGKVSEDAYVRHLALRHAPDRERMLKALRRRQGG